MRRLVDAGAGSETKAGDDWRALGVDVRGIVDAMDVWMDLRIVDVSELPGFHNPFRCGRRELFDDALREAVAGRRRAWEVWKPSVGAMVGSLGVEEIESITRRRRASLTRDELELCRLWCPYHQVDWVRIARAACWLVTEYGAGLTNAEWDAAVAEFEGLDRISFVSLFFEPINWHPDERTLVNGQHRSCGLFCAGVERVPVRPGPAQLSADLGE